MSVLFTLTKHISIFLSIIFLHSKHCRMWIYCLSIFQEMDFLHIRQGYRYLRFYPGIGFLILPMLSYPGYKKYSRKINLPPANLSCGVQGGNCLFLTVYVNVCYVKVMSSCYVASQPIQEHPVQMPF